MDAITIKDDTEPDNSKPLSTMTVEHVYHTYGPRVHNIARSMVRNDFDAEDVTQDVLLQVVRKLSEFRGECAFSTWLHKITVNAALQHRRKRAVRDEAVVHHSENKLLEEGRPRLEKDWMNPPEELLEDEEARGQIKNAIADLPARYREVFELSELEGLSNAAIGKLLELSLSAVKSRLHRARAMMRDSLASYFEEALV